MGNSTITVNEIVNELIVVENSTILEITDPTSINILEITQEHLIEIHESDSINILEAIEQGPIGPIGATGPAGPVGPAGPSSAFIYTQTSPSIEWVVNHNLGFKPCVAVSDAGGQIGVADVLNTSLNQLRVYFSVPTAGQVRCI